MAAMILDGREVARQIREELSAQVAALAAQGVTPHAAVVRVGSDEGSVGYAKSLARTFAQAGLTLTVHELPADAPADEVSALLRTLSAAPDVHGVMLQEPLPAPLLADELVLAIDPSKDVDGVHPYNAGKLFQGRADGFVPATAAGGIEILARAGIAIEGCRAMVVGRSRIVGRPLALLLLARHATVTVAHTRTRDLPALAREADLLAVAAGRPWLVTPEWVKPGATVLDFGTNYIAGEMRGDVAPEVAEVAGALTPTPGGTGPVTTAMLLRAVVAAALASTTRT